MKCRDVTSASITYTNRGICCANKSARTNRLFAFFFLYQIFVLFSFESSILIMQSLEITRINYLWIKKKKKKIREDDKNRLSFLEWNRSMRSFSKRKLILISIPLRNEEKLNTEDKLIRRKIEV